ncbi:MAG TPA: hypothetical protein VK886_14600 [Vicinamibacterales bacterium]|nr:hypothetical protein [Vicinamibacterales bacterium]
MRDEVDAAHSHATATPVGGRRPLYYWPVIALLVCTLGYAAFAGLGWWLYADALRQGQRARAEFGGDEVEALITLVASERHTLAERGRAVHALGQLRDRRALPVLERFYTADECDHARFLCQRELRKAIEKCRGGMRPPGWLPFLAPGS